MSYTKNKSQNNYNQIIKEMNQLNISKEQQIEYLKSRLIFYETEIKRKILIERLLFSGAFMLLFGFFLISIKLYHIGLIIMLMTCIFLSYKFITLAKRNQKISFNETHELEKLNSLFEAKLK